MKNINWTLLAISCVLCFASSGCLHSSDKTKNTDVLEDVTSQDADALTEDLADTTTPPDMKDTNADDALEMNDTAGPDLFVPWDTIFRNPGFEQGMADWTAVGQATAKDGAGHNGSAYYGYLPPNDGSWVSPVGVAQLLDMPFAEHLPASLEFYMMSEEYAGSCSSSLVCHTPRLQVQLGDTPISFELASNYTTPDWELQHICLGESDFSGTVQAFQTSLLGSEQTFEYSAGRMVDDFSVQADDSCPVPGVLLGGGFEEAVPLWAGKQPDYQGTVELTSTLDPHSGSQSLLATYGNRCTSSYWTTWASVPKDMVAPAVSFWAKGSGGEPAVLFHQPGAAFAQMYRAVFVGSDYQEYSVCLPRFVAGHAVPLKFGVFGAYNDAGIGCHSGFFTVALDDVALTDEHDCAADAGGLIDGGLENLPPSSPSAWQTIGGAKSSAASDARSGDSAAEFQVTSPCDLPVIRQLFQAPEILTGSVLKVTFWARTPQLVVPLKVLVADGELVEMTEFPTVSDTYKEYSVTIGPEHSKHVLVLSFQAYGGGGACAAGPTLSHVWLDDISAEVVPD